MQIKKQGDGEYILHAVKKNKVTFGDDELTLNLERYERDNEAHIDVCKDRYGNLVCGVIPGVAENYVAQIDIPARSYIETPAEVLEQAEGGEAAEDNGGMMASGGSREAQPFDIAKCVLTLWAI